MLTLCNDVAGHAISTVRKYFSETSLSVHVNVLQPAAKASIDKIMYISQRQQLGAWYLKK